MLYDIVTNTHKLCGRFDTSESNVTSQIPQVDSSTKKRRSFVGWQYFYYTLEMCKSTLTATWNIWQSAHQHEKGLNVSIFKIKFFFSMDWIWKVQGKFMSITIEKIVTFHINHWICCISAKIGNELNKSQWIGSCFIFNYTFP